MERWCAGADAADLSALRRCEGPVLDIGCGPGRLVAELAARGHRALGIDVSEAAVAHTLRTGGSALRRSVFDPLPGEGRWGTVLLIDGNIGIGGDPRGLLLRTAELLAPGGLLIAETAPLDIDERVRVRLYDGRPHGHAGGPDRTGAGDGHSRGPGSAPRPCSGTHGRRLEPGRSVDGGRPPLRRPAPRPEGPDREPERRHREQHGRDQQPVPEEDVGGQSARRFVVLRLLG